MTPASLRPTTAGAWVALVLALTESPAEAHVVPLAWAPTRAVRDVLRRLHAYAAECRGLPNTWPDFRPVWAALQGAPSERAVVDAAADAFDALPGLLEDGRALHVAIAAGHDGRRTRTPATDPCAVWIASGTRSSEIARHAA